MKAKHTLPDLQPAPATAEDLPGVIRLIAAAGLPTGGVSEAFPSGYAVIRAGAGLLGVAGLEVYETVGLLRSVAVTPDERGRGWGGALVEDRLVAAKSQGLERVYLLTTTAASCFESLGFGAAERSAAPACIQQSQEFAALCPASAVCLAISL